MANTFSEFDELPANVQAHRYETSGYAFTSDAFGELLLIHAESGPLGLLPPVYVVDAQHIISRLVCFPVVSTPVGGPNPLRFHLR